MATILPWAGLILLIIGFLALDLGVFNRKPHAISMREALIASLFWISVAMIFNGLIWHTQGPDPALAFLTGYILEKLLSLDNMFIFIMVFNVFAIGPKYQHRVLFWGILGAIIFRLFFILIGIKLVEAFEWTLYVFGALLVYSSYKILRDRNKIVDLEKKLFVKHLKKWIPFDETYKGSHFFIVKKGKWIATPLILALLTIEIMDVIFAVDSIPAIFAITLDPFIVFTSNIFAILGLRSLYFLLANIIPRFYYLQPAISFILGFVGVKLILANHYAIPLPFSLGLIAFILFIAVLASLWRDTREKSN